MTATRTFAVLRTDTMIGTAFIMPIVMMRVTQRPFPQVEDVYALLRQGGAMNEAEPVEVTPDEGQEICEALVDTFADILVSRPLFVDLGDGTIYAVRHQPGFTPFLAESGNVFAAFGRPLPQGTTEDHLYTCMFTSRSPILLCAALRAGNPALSIAEGKTIASNGVPVEMTAGQLTRTLLHAVRCSAHKHREITEGRQTDRFGPVLPTQVVESYDIAA
jgi:hypothetical protein